jgi:protein-L-isoaspartate(D-aspartate) O-methyltransferase
MTPDHEADPFDLVRRGIRNPRVLEAMRTVPREAFVPPDMRARASDDSPLPIGFGQTISQPFIVAWMTETLQVFPGHRVLEIGTGCGYQTAILAAVGAEVWSLEIIAELQEQAARTLARLGYGDRVHLRLGDGHDGWPDAAPFDRILLTAAPRDVPPALIDALAEGGRLVAPVGAGSQVIVIIERQDGKISRQESLAVRFVEMQRTGTVH